MRQFVSEEEEAALLEWVDSATWQPTAHDGQPVVGPTSEYEISRWNSPGAGNEGKNWGANTRSGATGRIAVQRFDPLPPPLLAVAERMAAVAPHLLEEGAWRPNQANAISYTKARGHYLGPHCDDRQLSGAVLCNLSLCGEAVMTYQHDRRPHEEPHRVVLPRRSLQLQTGDVRFNYRHGITNSDLRDPRRVSITLRKEKAG